MPQYARSDLEKIWAQVPADYYFQLNYGQRLWHEWKWLILKHLMLQIEPEPKTILEVGCAAGHLTALTQNVFRKAKITGVDIYAPAVVEAKDRYPTITFKVADAHKLPFKAESFDLAFSSETIEHVVDPGKMLAEMRRVLKKNGHAIIEMDSGSLSFRVIWYFWTRFGKGKVWREAHLHPFAARELEELIIASGFHIKKKMLSHFGMAISFLVTK